MIKRKNERDKYLLKEEYIKFINTCPDKYRIFWEVIFNAGLRVSEVLNITGQDIIWNENKIIIKTLKRRYHPAIPVIVPQRIIEQMKLYKEKKQIDGRLWTFSRQFAWQLFKRICIKAGLNAEYSPHALRHAHGVMIADITNGNVSQIKDRLRHSSTKSTEFYIHVSEKKQKELSQKISDYMEV